MQTSITTQKIIYDAKKDEAFSLEHSLPEYLPGISRIIKVHAVFDKCRFYTEDLKAFMEVPVKFHVIYLSDFSGKIKSAVFDESFAISFKEPFDEKNEYSSIPSVYMGSLSAKPLSGRKIQLKGSVHAACTVYSNEETELYQKNENDSHICVLTKSITVCESISIQSDVLSTGAELNLEKDSPAASEVILPKVNIHSLKCTAGDGKMVIDGKMSLYALYECAADEAAPSGDTSYAAVESEADFKSELEDIRIKEGQVCCAYIDVNSVECACSFDSYGESRVITFDIRYTVTATAGENKEYTAAEDVFSTEYALQTESKKLLCKRITKPLHCRSSVKETVHGDISGLYDISGCFASLRSVSSETVSGKAFAVVKCLLEAVGTNSSGEMLCVDIPVTLHVPVDECADADILDYVLTVSGCNASVKDGGLETEIEFDINGTIQQSEYIPVICSAEKTEQPVQKHPKGEIIVCYPCKDDCVWSLAKKHSVSPELVKQVNKLEDNSIPAGKVIIIP